MADARDETKEGLRALIIHAEDNVANLIGPGHRGGVVRCVVEGEAQTETIELINDIPSNHKFARRGIEMGEPIIKYGLSIGTASRAIGRGEHVHAHNVDSNRGRGDLKHG